MRRTLIFLALAFGVTLVANAAEPLSYTQGTSTSSVLASAGDTACSACDECNSGRHGLHGGNGNGRRNSRSGDWGNCNCNGSYKFPVPPLYTYHWPGRYSQQLMTDYHSPWRYPPLKPYTDEVRPNGAGVSSEILPTAAVTPVREPELLSEKIIRHYNLR